MISVNDFRTGATIEMDGQAYQVVDFPARETR
jgi:translation elongation factor P/translation initiation factor 5A